jgi:hypothetical protein
VIVPCVPRMRCARSLIESRALDGHPCFSVAIWCHLPYSMSILHSITVICRNRLLQDLALLDNALDLGDQGITHAHCAGQYEEQILLLSHTHSLCESKSHCGSWNCSHNVLRRCVHRPELGSQTLDNCKYNSSLEQVNRLTQKFVPESPLMT